MLADPFEAWVTLTYKCNLSCEFCYERNHRANSHNELSLSEWLNFIDEMADLKIFNVQLTGGEPFLYPHFKEILDQLKKRNIRYKILTNGTLITQEWCEYLANSNRCSGVQISLDGFEEYHDSIRGKGSFQKSVDAIKNLAAVGINVIVNSVVTRENYQSMAEFAKLLESLPIKSYRLNPRNDASVGEDEKSCGRLTLDELVDLASALDRHKEELKKINKNSLPISMLEMLKNPSQTAKTGCASMYVRFGVRPDGGVQMCPGMLEPIAGYIGKEPLHDIWNSQKFNDLRKLSSLPEERNGDECKSCQFKISCQNFCLSADPQYYCQKRILAILKTRGFSI